MDLSPNEHLILQLMRQGVTSNKALAYGAGMTEGAIAGLVHRLGKKGLVRNRQVVERKPVAKRGCQFIAGNPSADDACKCGKPIEIGSYCMAHYLRCYPPRAQYKPKFARTL